jgi:hypothetical protein
VTSDICLCASHLNMSSRWWCWPLSLRSIRPNVKNNLEALLTLRQMKIMNIWNTTKLLHVPHLRPRPHAAARIIKAFYQHGCTCAGNLNVFISKNIVVITYFLQQRRQHTTNCTKWLLVSACSLSHHRACHLSRRVGKNLTSDNAMRSHCFHKGRSSYVLTVKEPDSKYVYRESVRYNVRI